VNTVSNIHVSRGIVNFSKWTSFHGDCYVVIREAEVATSRSKQRRVLTTKCNTPFRQLESATVKNIVMNIWIQ